MLNTRHGGGIKTRGGGKGQWELDEEMMLLRSGPVITILYQKRVKMSAINHGSGSGGKLGWGGMLRSLFEFQQGEQRGKAKVIHLREGDVVALFCVRVK